MDFTAAAEGQLDLVVIERVAAHCGGRVPVIHNKRGHVRLDETLAGYANASRGSPWIVLRDQDRADCPVSLADELLPNRAEFPNLVFRVVTREIESWLLADREGFARFLGVSRDVVPNEPEEELQPKQTLINIAERSRHRHLRAGLVPRPGSGAKVGPEYNAILATFVREKWRPEVAAERAPCLDRFIAKLQAIIQR